MDLIDYLRRKLPAEELARLRAEANGPSDVDYDAITRRVVSKLRGDEELFAYARSRLELSDRDLLDVPEGRRATILRNSSPVVLIVLFRDLLRQSWRERLGDRERSLRLAHLAIEVALALARTRYLSPELLQDLLAEGLGYLGNAQRINSDLRAAEESLGRAENHFAAGSGDRILKADLLMLRMFLRFAQGRCVEAAELADREIALRRLLGDRAQLGFALIQRGWIGSMIGDPFHELFDLLLEATTLVEEPYVLLQATQSLATALAREGRGIEALQALTGARIPMSLFDSERLRLSHRWTRGITYRTLGELERAESDLLAVRQGIAAHEPAYRVAIYSLDLACVYAAQGRLEDVRRLAEEAFKIFQAEGLEERALTAVVVLREAIEAERVTEGLAVAVANFLARFPYNKSLRFEWKDD